MPQGFSKESIFRLISTLCGFEKTEISEEGIAYKLSLQTGNKAIVFTWPYELGEVFVDFLENDDVAFSDWFECLEAEEVGDFVSYIEEVARRYLNSETRVFRKGIVLESRELQYFTNGEWFNVLCPAQA